MKDNVPSMLYAKKEPNFIFSGQNPTTKMNLPWLYSESYTNIVAIARTSKLKCY